MNTLQPALGADTAPARPRPVVGQGRIYFWNSGSLWIGRGSGRSDWHDHHAHQLALAFEGEMRFRCAEDGAWASYQAAIVTSHQPHQFEIDGIPVAHLFVEPESREGRQLAQLGPGTGVSALPADAASAAARTLQQAWAAHGDAACMVAAARAAVALLAGLQGEAAEVDARVARAIEHVRARLRGPITLAEAAAAACLSPSRFRHLFVQQTGTPFRAYLLWLRLNVAIEAAMRGASWTEAAHEAGFADSAHLARTHRRMFGIEPSAIRAV